MDRTLETMTRKWRDWCKWRNSKIDLGDIPKLLAAVVRDEREACAKMAEGRFHRHHALMPPVEAAAMIAEAIREQTQG